MADFSTIFSRGPKNTLLFKNGGQFLYKGPWTQVYQNTEIDRWYVGDFSSANYTITVEVNSNKKETLQVLVIARPDYANYTIYGRVSIDDEIIDLDVSVNDSYLSFTVNAKIPEFEGAKLFYHVSYSGSVHSLIPPIPVSYLVPNTQPSTPTSDFGLPGTPVINAFTSIESNLVPLTTANYDIGSPTNRWDNLYLSDTFYLGNVPLSASGNTINLPIGTQINGVAVSSFRTISVSGNDDIVADGVTDSLSLIAGDGILLTGDPQTKSITITNTGGSSSGSVVSSTSGPAFGTISVPGQSSVNADRVSDVLNIVAGANISIVTDPVTDSITISSLGGGAGGGGTATSIIVNEVLQDTFPILMASGIDPLIGNVVYANSGLTMNVTTGTVNATAATARWADLAEKYLADRDYQPGTVMVFGGDKEVTIGKEYKSRKIAGVISTQPAFIMNNCLESQPLEKEYSVTIALTGRVPCNVIGKISKGDMLVQSNIPGVATADDDPKLGSVIGKALEDYNNIESVGQIEIVVGKL